MATLEAAWRTAPPAMGERQGEGEPGGNLSLSSPRVALQQPDNLKCSTNLQPIMAGWGGASYFSGFNEVYVRNRVLTGVVMWNGREGQSFSNGKPVATTGGGHGGAKDSPGKGPSLAMVIFFDTESPASHGGFSEENARIVLWTGVKKVDTKSPKAARKAGGSGGGIAAKAANNGGNKERPASIQAAGRKGAAHSVAHPSFFSHCSFMYCIHSAETVVNERGDCRVPSDLCLAMNDKPSDRFVQALCDGNIDHSMDKLLWAAMRIHARVCRRFCPSWALARPAMKANPPAAGSGEVWPRFAEAAAVDAPSGPPPCDLMSRSASTASGKSLDWSTTVKRFVCEVSGPEHQEGNVVEAVLVFDCHGSRLPKETMRTFHSHSTAQMLPETFPANRKEGTVQEIAATSTPRGGDGGGNDLATRVVAGAHLHILHNSNTASAPSAGIMNDPMTQMPTQVESQVTSDDDDDGSAADAGYAEAIRQGAGGEKGEKEGEDGDEEEEQTPMETQETREEEAGEEKEAEEGNKPPAMNAVEACPSLSDTVSKMNEVLVSMQRHWDGHPQPTKAQMHDMGTEFVTSANGLGYALGAHAKALNANTEALKAFTEASRDWGKGTLKVMSRMLDQAKVHVGKGSGSTDRNGNGSNDDGNGSNGSAAAPPPKSRPQEAPPAPKPKPATAPGTTTGVNIGAKPAAKPATKPAAAPDAKPKPKAKPTSGAETSKAPADGLEKKKKPKKRPLELAEGSNKEKKVKQTKDK